MYQICSQKYMCVINPLTMVPEITRSGVYGECVLKQNLPVFNGFIPEIYLKRPTKVMMRFKVGTTL